jgi:GT2 family glycosyltransferase
MSNRKSTTPTPGTDAPTQPRGSIGNLQSPQNPGDRRSGASRVFARSAKLVSEVIVVTFNSARDIRPCINSILTNGAVPVIVDNGSTDDTLGILAREFPQVRVLLNADNGYSRAANIGFANTSGAFVILSNADVIYPSGSIARLVEYLESHPRIGVLGPQQVFPDQSWQRSWGMVTGVREALCELFGVTTLSNALRRASWPLRLNRRALNVGYVDGAVMAVRRSAFDSIGGFDERFRFSSEETDFCVRIRSAGWRVVVLPTVDVIHRRGGSSSSLDWSTERHTAVLLEGTRIFLEKHRGPRFTLSYFAIKRLSNWNLMVLCELASHLVPSALRRHLKDKARIHRAYLAHLRTAGRALPVSSFF